MAFVYPHRERKCQTLCQFVTQQFANVFDRWIFEKVIPGPVVVMSQNFAQGQFQVGEINDHPVLGLAHDSEFNSIGVSMERPTFSVPGKEMRAVNVFGHTQLHYCENSLTRPEAAERRESNDSSAVTGAVN